MRFTLSAMAVVAAGLGLALDGAIAAALKSRKLDVAGLESSITLQCQLSVMGLVGSPVGACLNLAAAVPIFSTDPSSPIIPAVTDYITGVCATPVCSPDDIRTSMQKVADGCKQELANTPFNGTALLDKSVKFIPIFKKLLCLKDSTAPAAGTNGTFCATTFLQTLQDALLGGQPLTPASFNTVLPVLLGQNSTAPGADKLAALGCSQCAKDAEAIVAENMPEGPTKNALQSKLDNDCPAPGAADPSSPDPSSPATPSSTESAAPAASSTAPPLARRDLSTLSRRSANTFFKRLLGMLW